MTPRKKKKSGRITLRMDPEIHARVDATARALGLDLNGMLNLIIREGLVRHEVEAQMLKQPDTEALLAEWRQFNPTRSVSAFLTDLWRMGPPTYGTQQFEDGKRYDLSADGKSFQLANE